MKVYFTAPIKGVDDFSGYFKKIEHGIVQLGYQLIDNVSLRVDDPTFYEKLDKGGKEAHENFFNKTIQSIKTSDVNIFECSIPSLGVGFQIEKSIQYNKPTIVLHYKKHVPHFLTGTQSDKLFIAEYEEKTLPMVLKKVIEDAKHAADKRFNFFISPALLVYLEEESNRLDMTKSAFIRKLLLDHKKKKYSK